MIKTFFSNLTNFSSDQNGMLRYAVAFKINDNVMLAYFTIVKVLFEKNGDVIKSNQMLDLTYKMLIKFLTIFVVQFWTEEYKL